MGVDSVLPSPPHNISPSRTFDLLCACCTAHPTPAQIAHIATLQFADFDWPEFLRQAEHHGVLALAAHNLTQQADNLPHEIRGTLESAHATSFRPGLWFAAELMRVTQQLARRGVRAIPYKGPVLAQSAYGDLALRSFSDLDLLISPADFDQAKNALAEIAYRPSKPQTPAVERLWLKTGYECSFDGPAGKNLVELQWALLPRFYAVASAQFQFDDLWSRAGRVALGASDTAAVPCLAPEDSLLILSLHAAKHLWTRLIWVADIAETLRAPSLDLAQVISRARAAGIARILGVSLNLARNLLGAPIPEIAQAAINSDPAISPLTAECSSRLAHCATYDFQSTQYFRQILRLRERPADRSRYLWRLLFTPSEGDIQSVTLPEPMFPLYRAVRLARLLRKLAKPRG